MSHLFSTMLCESCLSVGHVDTETVRRALLERGIHLPPGFQQGVFFAVRCPRCESVPRAEPFDELWVRGAPASRLHRIGVAMKQGVLTRERALLFLDQDE